MNIHRGAGARRNQKAETRNWQAWSLPIKGSGRDKAIRPSYLLALVESTGKNKESWISRF
jgi:hypothetical protein